MILKVGYLPFPADQQLIDMTERVIVGHNASHRMDQFNAKLHKPGAKALQGVLRIQQLYVFAHGTTGGAGHGTAGGIENGCACACRRPQNNA